MITLLLLLGAPGSGKGTFTSEFVRATGCSRFSTGECFRSVMNDPSHPFYEAVRARMDEADFVPDDLTLKVVRGQLAKYAKGTTILMDGFPRTRVQAEALDELDATLQIGGIFFLDVPESELAQRLLGRRLCLVCGSIYHQELRPPKADELCDTCRIPLTRRYDDTAEWIPKRIGAFAERTAPVVDYYERQDRLIRVDGTLAPQDAVAFARSHLQDDRAEKAEEAS